MRKQLLTILSVFMVDIVIAGYAAPASANIVYVTVTGTVTSGTDVNGDFGTAGSSLAGQAYTAQYEFNMANYSCGTRCVQGGTAVGYASPIIASSITINGDTFAISGSYFGQIADNASENAARAYSSAALVMYSQLYDYNSAPFGGAFVYSNLTGNSKDVGEFYDQTTALVLGESIYGESLTAPVAVPEPSAVALFGVGVFGIGLLAKRRRRFGLS